MNTTIEDAVGAAADGDEDGARMQIEALIGAAMAAEREACAKVADVYEVPMDAGDAAPLAAAIRARGQAKPAAPTGDEPDDLRERLSLFVAWLRDPAVACRDMPQDIRAARARDVEAMMVRAR